MLHKRANVYEAAKKRHPERWSGAARNWQPVRVVHLNPDQRVTEKRAKGGIFRAKNGSINVSIQATNSLKIYADSESVNLDKKPPTTVKMAVGVLRPLIEANYF